MDEIEVNICAGFTEESAEIHLSAFRTIIEASAQVIANPRPMLEAYAEYFTPVINQAIANGDIEKEEAWDMADQALSRLFSITQRLAFMMGTELAEAAGDIPMPSDLMDDPVYRQKDKDVMKNEEVMEELSRIIKQPEKENN